MNERRYRNNVLLLLYEIEFLNSREEKRYHAHSSEYSNKQWKMTLLDTGNKDWEA